MRQYIKKIQSKSEDTRKLIFLGAMILSMSFVSFVWIYSLGAKFSNSKIKEQANEDIKPFKLFASSISDTYKSIGASVGKSSIVNEIKTETQASQANQIDLIPVENNNQ